MSTDCTIVTSFDLISIKDSTLLTERRPSAKAVSKLRTSSTTTTATDGKQFLHGLYNLSSLRIEPINVNCHIWIDAMEIE